MSFTSLQVRHATSCETCAPASGPGHHIDASVKNPTSNSFDEPLCVSVNVDHRHRSAKLKLGDQLEQECGRGLSLNSHLMRVVSRIKKEMPVRSDAPDIKRPSPVSFGQCLLK